MRNITSPHVPLVPLHHDQPRTLGINSCSFRLVVHFLRHTHPTSSFPSLRLASPRLKQLLSYTLFLPLQDVPRHLQEPLLGLALGEMGDGGGRLVGVVLGQRARLLDAVGLEDQLAGLMSR